jgi:hypothetical protein
MKRSFLPLLIICAIAPLTLIVPRLSSSPIDASEALQVATITPTNFSYLPLVLKEGWRDCSQSSFGTMLIAGEPDDWITPADVLIYANDQLGVKGMAGTGAPSDQVRDEWFGRLPGWTRMFMRGTYDTLTNIHWGATMFGMENMYECFAYGPESAHEAGDEALNPTYWVPQAVKDYERMCGGEGNPQDALLAALIAQVAPHVDIWMIQVAKYQSWVDIGHDYDGSPYAMDDFKDWITKWVSWIKTANPNARVWTQMGIGRWDPIQQACLPPQPPEYILEFRQVLHEAGVDGVWVMPSQSCQPCPPSPPPGFLCSDDPQDNEYYQQSLAVFQEAIEMACGQ